MSDDNNQPTGARLRDEGVAATLAADHAINRDWRDPIEVALAEVIRSGAEFTSEDVRARLAPDVIVGMSSGLLGAVLQQARRTGRIRQTGWAISLRPSRHAGPVRTWTAVPASGNDWTAAA